MWIVSNYARDLLIGMPIKYTVTITSVGSSNVIVLPRPVLDGFNLKKGQKLSMIVKDDGIYIPLTERKNNVEELMDETENK